MPTIEERLSDIERTLAELEVEKDRIEARYVWSQWETFDSHWRAEGGTEHELGTDSSLISAYKHNDFMVFVLYLLRFGSGLYKTGGAGTWNFNVPVDFDWERAPFQNRDGQSPIIFGSGYIVVSSQNMLVTPVLENDSTGAGRIRLFARAAITAGHKNFVKDGNPVTWVSGDFIQFSLIYPFSIENVFPTRVLDGPPGGLTIIGQSSGQT